jgi:uncharacterized RDD family membrane protein YckC
MNWYYAEAGKQVGPVTDEQFVELVRTTAINDDTLVWHDGLTDWAPYRQIKNSQAAAAAAAPGTAGTFPAVQGGPGMAICAECKKTFPMAEMIHHGNSYICAACKPIFMQKLAEGANIGDMNYAPVGTRFAAVFLDGILLWVFNILTGLAAGVGIGATMRGNVDTALGLRMALLTVQIIVALCYEGFMVGKYGATLGKMACKIKVVTSEGQPVSYGRSFGRYFAKMLSGLTCLIGYIMACFDDEKRALHDRICNTRVVMK